MWWIYITRNVCRYVDWLLAERIHPCIFIVFQFYYTKILEFTIVKILSERNFYWTNGASSVWKYSLDIFHTFHIVTYHFISFHSIFIRKSVNVLECAACTRQLYSIPCALHVLTNNCDTSAGISTNNNRSNNTIHIWMSHFLTVWTK